MTTEEAESLIRRAERAYQFARTAEAMLRELEVRVTHGWRVSAIRVSLDVVRQMVADACAEMAVLSEWGVLKLQSGEAPTQKGGAGE